MDPFKRLTATACPIGVANINTDQILPARFLKWPRSAGLGQVLFKDMRFDGDSERPDFPLHRPVWRDAKIVVAERNFGCGSSREAAVYALYDYGIRCVIAPSFGDIFAGNAVQNGLLTAAVTEDETNSLLSALEQHPERPMTVDLEAQTIVFGDLQLSFSVDPVVRIRLLNGWDDITMTQSYSEQIDAFRARDKVKRPWAMAPTPHTS